MDNSRTKPIVYWQLKRIRIIMICFKISASHSPYFSKVIGEGLQLPSQLISNGKHYSRSQSEVILEI